MAGDSTMANKKPERYPETGWGQVFSSFFTNDIEVVNLAVNGRSTKSFVNEKKWEKLLADVRPNDYVFIEFGHNDEKVENSNLGTTPDEYEANLTKFVQDVKALKAIPVLLTPVMRRSIKDGKFYDSHGEYPDRVRKVAKAEKVALIDMDEKSKTLLEATGTTESKKFFLHGDSAVLENYPKGIHDNTHFNEAGAYAMAQLAIEGIKALQLPLANYIKKDTAK